MLLEQTKGTGVDVYTHSEMLPACSYPAFKKYPHFVGNYGNAWWQQKEEFESFNGPILMTTNCIVPPKPVIKTVFTPPVQQDIRAVPIFQGLRRKEGFFTDHRTGKEMSAA